MTTAGPAQPDRHDTPRVARLGEQEQSVVSILLEHEGRVISRRELARKAGLTGLSERRCDSLLVMIRRALGPEAIITVRSRGWMLSACGVAAAVALGYGQRE